MLSVAPGEAVARVQLMAKATPPEMEPEVLREYDTPQGRWQECQVQSSGLIFKRQVGAREVPRSKGLPERPPVRLVTKVLPPVVRKPAKPAAGGAEAVRTNGDVPPPPREALQDLPAQPGGSPLPGGNRSAGSSCAAPAQPPQPPAGSQQASAAAEGQRQPAPGSEPTAPSQQPDGPPLQLPQQQQQDVEMADAVTTDTQAAVPAAMAAAAAATAQPAAAEMSAEATAAALLPKTPAKSWLSQATTARHVPDFAGAGNAAIVAGAASSAVTHEYIHGVLEKVTGPTLEECQAAQAATIVQDALHAAVADLQRPGAAPGSDNGAALQVDTNTKAEVDAAARAQVAALLPMCMPALVAALLERTKPQGSLAALLNSQQPAQGAEESVPAADEYGLVGEEQTVAEKAALKAQLAGLTQETAQWDELNTQQLALTPERPLAAATGLLDDDAALPAAAVAAAREEAHQQLTLQVEGLCALVEGAAALLDSADATSARLQAAYEAAAFSELPHVDSPATLIRRAIRPLPPPPTPAAEKAAREV